MGIKDRYNENEVEHHIMTKPNEQTAENIKLLSLENGTNFVSFSLESPWKPTLSCIEEYQIEICANKVCSESSIEKRTDNANLQTVKKDLTPCTKYELKITPL